MNASNQIFFETQSTNFLSAESFEKFLQSLSKIKSFDKYPNRAPLNPEQLSILFRVMYGCGLRVSEAVSLKVKDLDLENRILVITSAKTGFKKCKNCKTQGCEKCNFKGKIRKSQYTTILPNDVSLLEKYIKKYCLNDDSLLFNNVSRQIIWSYGKQAGNLAGLKIYEMQDERSIKGIWTHLFRKSRAKQMLLDGASIELVKLKLRHSMNDATWRYTRPDINALLSWETKTYPLT